MTKEQLLNAEKIYLGQLLEAVQRCVYFLDATAHKIPWPLNGEELTRRKKDEQLFESLAAFNERFAKLQDTLSGAMRHTHLLSAEAADSFLRVLVFFEKQGVIDSIDSWQILRTARNLAAHDYEIDYAIIAEHFNTLYDLRGGLYQTASSLITYCEKELNIRADTQDFFKEFIEITEASSRV